MIAYRSGMWAYMHDMWVQWEGHGMLCMLLTRRMLRVCQYWMYERD
jgi:hypothetical protein